MYGLCHNGSRMYLFNISWWPTKCTLVSGSVVTVHQWCSISSNVYRSSPIRVGFASRVSPFFSRNQLHMNHVYSSLLSFLLYTRMKEHGAMAAVGPLITDKRANILCSCWLTSLGTQAIPQRLIGFDARRLLHVGPARKVALSVTLIMKKHR